eukprot:Skav210370  [mRNA]  locus=scaffold1357:474704:475540:- [translate_table: standard]
MFFLGLRGCDHADCTITWVPAHRDYRRLQGMDKVHAWFNHWVDRAANNAARVSATPLYADLVSQVQVLTREATTMATYLAGVARIFANEHQDTHPVPSRLTSPLVFGDLHGSPPADLDYTGAPYSPSFARSLCCWLSSLRWSPSAQDPCGPTLWTDTSWLELFWSHVWDTGDLPPFYFEGAWVLLQEDPSLAFVLPSFCTLFKVWKRQVDILVRLGFQVPWGPSVARTQSARFLGAQFDCPGVRGRMVLSHEGLHSLSSALQSACRLSALHLPLTINL